MTEPPPDLTIRPDLLEIGWCHSCGTWQRGRDARWLAMWSAQEFDWMCVECDDEPWGLGVWTMSGRDEPLCEHAGEHADAREVGWPCG